MAAHEILIDSSYYGNYVNPAVTSENFEFAGFTMPKFDGTAHRFTDSEFRELHNIFSNWSAGGINESQVLDNFNRFYSIFPDMEMPTDLKSYVFITRPELNLLSTAGGSVSGQLAQENANDPMLQQLAISHPEVLYMLTEHYSLDHDFISYLQGRTESLQLPEYQIATTDFAIPFYNYKFTYPTVTNQSETGGSFDITFREDSDLRITTMFQFWIYYMDAVMKNKMRASDSHIWDNYYDFMCSVYEIICDPSSERILWWDKYTGCYPTNVPVSNFSHNIKSDVDPKLSISFQYIKVEHHNPNILADFNQNTSGVGGSDYEPVYDQDFGIMGQSLVSCPKITLSDNGRSYLLRWYRKKNGTASNLSLNTPTLANLSRDRSRTSIYTRQLRNTIGVDPFTGQVIPDTRPRSNLSKHLQFNSLN